jgi:hypothetical protein
MGTVGRHLAEIEICGEALAHQAPEYVRESNDDGVDLATLNELFQCFLVHAH